MTEEIDGHITRHSSAFNTVGRVPLAALTLEQASSTIVEAAAHGRAGDVHLVNAYCVALAEKSDPYRERLVGSWLNLPDGLPLQWVSRLRGDQPALSQVRGRDLMDRVLADGVPAGLRHFLLGSTEETLAHLQAEVKRLHPGVQIVGIQPRAPREIDLKERERHLEAIRQSDAQVIWIGLGTPAQDEEAVALASSIGVVCIGVGAAFDFIAGNQAEAPGWMRSSGLEWLHRLLSEPRRLWRRYLIGNLTFIKSVAANWRRGS